MTKNVAHRGYSELYPENTMLSFRMAWDAHCDAIELDVQLSRDNELVVIHDEKLERTTDGKGNVRDLTLFELKKLDASAAFRGTFGRNEIPTLREYFELVRELPLYSHIEMKNSVMDSREIEEKLIALIREYSLEEKTVISSFNHPSILKCKRLAPKIKCGFISGSLIIRAGEYSKKNGVEFFHPRYAYLTHGNLKELKKNGIHVLAWTVNKEKDMRLLIEEGVYGIITNNPEKLHLILEEYR